METTVGCCTVQLLEKPVFALAGTHLEELTGGHLGQSARAPVGTHVENSEPVTFPMLVFYPAQTPEKTERFGPYRIEVAKDAPLKDGTFPLVIISHGSGGSHLVYRTLARYLAQNGFVVGMPEHPFNNRNDNSRYGRVVNLIMRPSHLSTAIDWFYDSEKFGKQLEPDCVSVIGHSLGGYTALAAAGGVPTSVPKESADGEPKRLEIETDTRIKSLVLLAPAAVWFRAPGALSGVNLPILMLVGDLDDLASFGFHGQLILNGVPDRSKVEYRIIENAGHFCFLSPFPKAVTHPDFAPSQDPSGFDREKFLDELNIEVLEFLRRHT